MFTTDICNGVVSRKCKGCLTEGRRLSLLMLSVYKKKNIHHIIVLEINFLECSLDLTCSYLDGLRSNLNFTFKIIIT